MGSVIIKYRIFVTITRTPFFFSRGVLIYELIIRGGFYCPPDLLPNDDIYYKHEYAK